MMPDKSQGGPVSYTHLNRLCDTICDTVIASEGAEKVRGMWNISEQDVYKRQVPYSPLWVYI